MRDLLALMAALVGQHLDHNKSFNSKKKSIQTESYSLRYSRKIFTLISVTICRLMLLDITMKSLRWKFLILWQGRFPWSGNLSKYILHHFQDLDCFWRAFRRARSRRIKLTKSTKACLLKVHFINTRTRDPFSKMILGWKLHFWDWHKYESVCSYHFSRLLEYFFEIVDIVMVHFPCFWHIFLLFTSRLFDVKKETIVSRVHQSQYVLVSGAEIDIRGFFWPPKTI